MARGRLRIGSSPPRPARSCRARSPPSATCAPRSRSTSRCSSRRSPCPPCGAATSRSRSPRRAASPATPTRPASRSSTCSTTTCGSRCPPITARHAPRDRALRAARRGLDVRLPHRHLRGLQRRAARLPGRRLPAGIAYQSDDYFAIRPRGQRHGRRAHPRPRAGQHARRRRGAAGKGRPPYRRVAAITAAARRPAARSRRCSNVSGTPARSTPSPGSPPPPEPGCRSRRPVVAVRVAGLEVARAVVLVERSDTSVPASRARAWMASTSGVPM